VPSILVKQEIILLPLKWVFTYKVNVNGFLTRCCSRIIVYNDLQEEFIILSTYVITLVARSFQIACTIVAHFNLEMKQFDIMNTFMNVTRSLEGLLVICKLLPGFERPRYVVKVNYTLYKLQDSFAL
jgi:hypothetical protein